MSDINNDFTQSFDARDWVVAWLETVKKNPSIATDEGTMLGWFANAIMRSYDEYSKLHPEPDTSAECSWVQEDWEDSTYGTTCGHYFSINDGTPEDNHFKFCCYCGLPLRQALYEERIDDD